MNLHLYEVRIDNREQQLDRHGDTAFPAAFYEGDLRFMKVPWHWHDELELILCFQGTIAVGSGTMIHLIPEGGGCFINSGVLHSVWKPGESPAIYHSIVFHPRLIGSRESVFWLKYVTPLTEPSFPHFIQFRQTQENEKQIIADIKRAWECAAAEAPAYENESRYCLTRVLGMMSTLSGGLPRRLTRKEKRDMDRMKEMLTWLEDHFSEDISIGQIAASCGISESECLLCFKRNVGNTPVRYLIEYRLRRAAELLVTGQTGIAEAAAACGFSDMSYFSRLFKSKYEKSPSEYRSSFDS